MSEGKASVTDFINRFEDLKKKYFFNSNGPRFDADGEEIISPYPSRPQIVEMLTKMNLELPMHPGEPPIPIGGRTESMVGEWWKKPRQMK